MTSLAHLNRAAIISASAALNETLSSSGVPTYKYLDFATQRAVFRYRENEKEVEVPVGTELAVNWQGITHGWLCWKASKPFDQIHWNVFAMPTLMEMEDLPDHGPYVNDTNSREGWVRQMTIPMRNVSTGDDFLFKTGPDSAYRAANRFLAELRAELVLRADSLKSETDVLDVTPVVTLAKTHFTPKGRTNKIFVPSFQLNPIWVKTDKVNFSKLPEATGRFSREELQEQEMEQAAASQGRTIDLKVVE